MPNVRSSRSLFFLIAILCAVFTHSYGQQDHKVYKLSMPSVIIGEPDDGITLYEPWDYTISTGDTLYLLDHRDCQVYAFNIQGNHLFSFGGRGQGPGEFLDAWAIEYANGNVFTMDVRIQRICVFSSTGEFIRSIPLNRATYDMVVDQDFIYVSTSWFEGAPVTRISIESPDVRTPLLEDAAQFFPEVDFGDFFSMGMRSGRIPLSFINNQLIAAFPRVGVIAVLPLDRETVEPRWIKLDHPLIEEYTSKFRKKLRGYEGPGTIIPNVMWEATPWLNGALACRIRTYDHTEYEGVELVLFSLETGREVGVVRTPDILISEIRLLNPRLAAGIDREAATLLLCEIHY